MPAKRIDREEADAATEASKSESSTGPSKRKRGDDDVLQDGEAVGRKNSKRRREDNSRDNPMKQSSLKAAVTTAASESSLPGSTEGTTKKPAKVVTFAKGAVTKAMTDETTPQSAAKSSKNVSTSGSIIARPRDRLPKSSVEAKKKPATAARSSETAEPNHDETDPPSVNTSSGNALTSAFIMNLLTSILFPDPLFQPNPHPMYQSTVPTQRARSSWDTESNRACSNVATSSKLAVKSTKAAVTKVTKQVQTSPVSAASSSKKVNVPSSGPTAATSKDKPPKASESAKKTPAAPASSSGAQETKRVETAPPTTVISSRKEDTTGKPSTASESAKKLSEATASSSRTLENKRVETVPPATVTSSRKADNLKSFSVLSTTTSSTNTRKPSQSAVKTGEDLRESSKAMETKPVAKAASHSVATLKNADTILGEAGVAEFASTSSKSVGKTSSQKSLAPVSRTKSSKATETTTVSTRDIQIQTEVPPLENTSSSSELQELKNVITAMSPDLQEMKSMLTTMLSKFERISEITQANSAALITLAHEIRQGEAKIENMNAVVLDIKKEMVDPTGDREREVKMEDVDEELTDA